MTNATMARPHTRAFNLEQPKSNSTSYCLTPRCCQFITGTIVVRIKLPPVDLISESDFIGVHGRSMRLEWSRSDADERTNPTQEPNHKRSLTQADTETLTNRQTGGS